MKFAETKLPNVKIIEDAFNHAQANIEALGPEIQAKLEAQLSIFKEMRIQLERVKESGQLTDEQYKYEKSRLEPQINALEKGMPQIVAQQIDATFRQKILPPVLELHAYSDASPEALAAALLLESVPDPVEYEEIVEKFGKSVSDPLKNVLHLDAHRGAQQEAHLAKASEDEKRIFKAELAVELKKLPLQGKQIAPGGEQTLFKPIQQLWGGDKKQDARLVDLFNRAASALKSSYKIEVNDNAPVLVKAKPPQKPIIGDDGF